MWKSQRYDSCNCVAISGSKSNEADYFSNTTLIKEGQILSLSRNYAENEYIY